jgi:hypothetical protein
LLLREAGGLSRGWASVCRAGRTRGSRWLIAAAVAGCGGQSASGHGGALPPSYIPLTVGPGPSYEPPVRAPSGRRTIAGLGCSKELGRRFGVHVELFAHRHVVLIAPGIGVVGPVRLGPVVRSGRCYFPLVTLEPTGVVDVRSQVTVLTLGQVFALWGQPLTPTRLAGFAGSDVAAFVDGHRVTGDPADIRLRRHDEIVLETSGYVIPHASYRFVDGL